MLWQEWPAGAGAVCSLIPSTVLPDLTPFDTIAQTQKGQEPSCWRGRCGGQVTALFWEKTDLNWSVLVVWDGGRSRVS